MLKCHAAAWSLRASPLSKALVAKAKSQNWMLVTRTSTVLEAVKLKIVH